MNRWMNWIQGIQQEIKAFLFFSILFTLFRIVFLIIFQSQLDTTTMDSILMSLWLGFRLSLKTVGSIVLVSLLFATLPSIVWPKWKAQGVRKVWYSLVTILFTLLFMGRIPFYTIFNSSYNEMLINGKHDDIHAIINTAINEYHAIPFLIGGIVLSIGLTWLLVKVLNTKTIQWSPNTKRSKWITGILSFVGFGVLFLFFRFGGAFGYTNSINWESAARLNSNLLNETILDDAQALYRVKSIAKRTSELEDIHLTPAELHEKIQAIGGNPNSIRFDEAFTKTITTERLQQQPQSINIILGESYGLWPFLAEFNEPGAYLVEQGRKYAASPQAMGTQMALAQGTGTMPAIIGLLTGMPDTGMYPNYSVGMLQEPYGLGIGPVMKKLGYKTVFWYGGFSTWQNVKNFALEQGFDEFHDASEMPSNETNAWGVADGDMFKAINAYMDKHRGEKIINVIMTTSNHPPYSVNVAKEGYDADKVRKNLPDSIANTDKQINEMGHIWYADHVMGEFISKEEQSDPTSLFVITGDHSERFTFAHEEGPKVASTIPIIFYGQGIKKEWLSPDVFGMSIQIIPTLAELVGRTGQTYEAMVPSLFNQGPFVFNHRLWMDKTGIYVEDEKMPQAYAKYMKDMREITAWRLKYGNLIQ
mgnify:CR=1 FL=1